MATIQDLPQLIATDPAIREDFIATLVAFCQRHDIEASAEHFTGLTGFPSAPEDTQGHLSPGTPVGVSALGSRMVLCGGPWVYGAAVILPGTISRPT